MSELGSDRVVLVGRDLAVSYGETAVFEHVDIELKAGRITAMLGPSGAGKSTLLRAIAGFEPLRAGQVTVDGNVLSDASHTVPPEKRGMGIVVQQLALFPHLTAAQNIAFGVNKQDSREVAAHWLDQIGLPDRANAYPHELSGGEQQRVALARALAPKPSVVLLDEAFSSLDPQLRRALRRETKTLLKASDAAILMVTHDPDEAAEMADEVMVMAAGQVLQCGRPQDLYWKPNSLTVAELMGEVNVLSGVCGDGFLETPFGKLFDNTLVAGETVRAIVRPSVIKVAPSEGESGARIISAEFQGNVVRIVAEALCGATVSILTDGSIDSPVNAHVQLSFDAERIVFYRVL